MSETLKDVFIKHNMSAITGFDKEKSIFGVGDNGKFNIVNNNLIGASVHEINELFGHNSPQISLHDFADDSRKAMELMGIKNITGEYSIYIDDGNVLIIEGGKIIVK